MLYRPDFRNHGHPIDFKVKTQPEHRIDTREHCFEVTAVGNFLNLRGFNVSSKMFNRLIPDALITSLSAIRSWPLVVMLTSFNSSGITPRKRSSNLGVTSGSPPVTLTLLMSVARRRTQLIATAHQRTTHFALSLGVYRS